MAAASVKASLEVRKQTTVTSFSMLILSFCLHIILIIINPYFHAWFSKKKKKIMYLSVLAVADEPKQIVPWPHESCFHCCQSVVKQDTEL